MGDPLPLFIRCTLCPCGKRPAGKSSCFVRYRHFGCILWLFNGRNSDIRFGFFAVLFIPRFQPTVRNPFRTLPPIKILLSGI